ncbi:hypothetical protein [Nocardia beijingensis]|uniref:Uncharacterized protein n=1 Tax=Nocardia beijingensis TaxID=95162 RepID=A0ABW7WB64_9NOCA
MVVVGSGIAVVVDSGVGSDVVVVVGGSVCSVVGGQLSVGVAIGHAGPGVVGGGAGTAGIGLAAATDTGTAPSSPAMAAATRSAGKSFLMITSPETGMPQESNRVWTHPGRATRVANYSFPSQ